MCVKLPYRDLNPNSCLSHPTNTYTCEVTIAQRVCNYIIIIIIKGADFFLTKYSKSLLDTPKKKKKKKRLKKEKKKI